jgi:hypothetical protein
LAPCSTFTTRQPDRINVNAAASWWASVWARTASGRFSHVLGSMSSATQVVPEARSWPSFSA